MTVNPRPGPDRVVVVGASAGGVEALTQLVAGLPPDFPAPLLVVLHVSPHSPSVLPTLLGRAGPLPAVHAQDGEPLLGGRIYVAPPDHHLLTERGHLRVVRGPRENRFRPSVDALFRSAAYEYGPAVVGVILSGTMDDGTSGLWTVGQRGGLTVVQEPGDALFSDMPSSALKHVTVDHVVPLAGLAPLLTRLVRAPDATETTMNDPEPAGLEARLDTEVAIVRGESALARGVLSLGDPSVYTCPDCHGALRAIREGSLTRYRCHTGHAFTGRALLAGLTETINDDLWSAMRGLEERALLLHDLGDHASVQGEQGDAEHLLELAHQAELSTRQIRQFLIENRAAEAVQQTPI